MATKEERPPMEYREDEIDPGKYFAVLRKEWWKIGLLSLGVGLVTLIVIFQMKNIFQVTAVIAPPVEGKDKIFPSERLLLSGSMWVVHPGMKQCTSAAFLLLAIVSAAALTSWME